MIKAAHLLEISSQIENEKGPAEIHPHAAQAQQPEPTMPEQFTPRETKGGPARNLRITTNQTALFIIRPRVRLWTVAKNDRRQQREHATAGAIDPKHRPPRSQRD